MTLGAKYSTIRQMKQTNQGSNQIRRRTLRSFSQLASVSAIVTAAFNPRTSSNSESSDRCCSCCISAIASCNRRMKPRAKTRAFSARTKSTNRTTRAGVTHNKRATRRSGWSKTRGRSNELLAAAPWPRPLLDARALQLLSAFVPGDEFYKCETTSMQRVFLP